MRMVGEQSRAKQSKAGQSGSTAFLYESSHWSSAVLEGESCRCRCCFHIKPRFQARTNKWITFLQNRNPFESKQMLLHLSAAGEHNNALQIASRPYASIAKLLLRRMSKVHHHGGGTTVLIGIDHNEEISLRRVEAQPRTQKALMLRMPRNVGDCCSCVCICDNIGGKCKTRCMRLIT